MQDQAPAPDATIEARFGRIARMFPDTVALRGDFEAVSYADLDRRANTFAHFLRTQGVIPGDRVAVLEGRSAETIIAILGILKFGGVYVPLDRREPAHRLARMLDDSAPSLILSGPEPIAASGWRVVDLDDALRASASLTTTALAACCGPGDPACVMYTSGSTGQPKGVVVPHRAVLRLVTQQNYAPFGPDQTVLHLAPLAFDASTFEIWGALLHGGTLVVVEEDRASLDQIVAAIADHNVTVAWFAAGLFALLVDHCLDGLASLRCVITGGDVVSPAHVVRAYAALPRCSIVNGYGPTENTTFTCCYPIPRSDVAQDRLPIGRPIAGTQVHILDDEFRPVPTGETGQICCAGSGLADGYLNQPLQTAERFVRVPINGHGQQRVYLTGDLGRERHDGIIDFLGRMDWQVKIRGKRVELGEIENALRLDSAVRDAAVTARDAQPDGKRLTAHLVLRASTIDPEESVRAVLHRLRSALPDYMIPALARVLDALPLTTNGKIDRARLSDFEPLALDRPRPNTLSEVSLGDRIAAIWESVLRRSSIDRDVNFFDAGGNSLLLLDLHARLRAAFDPGLPLMALFEHTTIRMLTAHFTKNALGGPPSTQRRSIVAAGRPLCATVEETSP